jgi:hypothetical protein
MPNKSGRRASSLSVFISSCLLAIGTLLNVLFAADGTPAKTIAWVVFAFSAASAYLAFSVWRTGRRP